MISRQNFEDWLKAHTGQKFLQRDELDDSRYDDPIVNTIWAAWQAGAKLSGDSPHPRESINLGSAPRRYWCCVPSKETNAQEHSIHCENAGTDKKWTSVNRYWGEIEHSEPAPLGTDWRKLADKEAGEYDNDTGDSGDSVSVLAGGGSSAIRENMTQGEAMNAKEFYEANATNVVNVPRPNHPEDASGWAGVRRASEAQFVAKNVPVMPLWDAFDFAEKYVKFKESKHSEPAKETGK